MDRSLQAKLASRANEMRILILNMLTKAKSGHTGGSLSVVEILSYLYFHKMKHRPKDRSWPNRDRLVLSKGHAAPALYSALSMCGYVERDELFKLRRIAGSLQGHPDRLRTTGVDASTGSLGQGLSIANGMALGLKLSNINAKVFVILGDGELQEGQVWEAAMSAAHYGLSNVIAFVDANGLQIDGEVKTVMNVEPIVAKWEAFGWFVQEIDGHEFSQIDDAVTRASLSNEGRPSMVIARTIKGKGVSFMEGEVDFHGKSPTMDQLKLAMKELNGQVLIEEESG